MSHQIQYLFVPQDDVNNLRRRRVINSHATRYNRRQKRKATMDMALVRQRTSTSSRKRLCKHTRGPCKKCNVLSGPSDFYELPTDLFRSGRDDGFALRVQQPAWHTRTLNEQHLLANLNTFLMSSKSILSTKAGKWLDAVKLFLQMAFEYAFVMDAAITWSAAHLEFPNVDQQDVGINTLRRLRAIQGLQRAIANFSATNADAILAASVLLAWQSANSSDWQVLVTGIRDVSYQIKIRRFRSNIVLDDSFDCDTDEKIVETHPLTYGSCHFHKHYAMLLHILEGLFKYAKQPLAGASFSPVTIMLVQKSEALVQETLIGDRALPSSTHSIRLRRMLKQLPLDHTAERTYEPEELLVLAYLHALNALWATNQDWKRCRYNGLIAVAIEDCHEQLIKKLGRCSADKQKRCITALNSMGLALKISWMVRPFSSKLKKYNIELDEDGRFCQGQPVPFTECNMKVLEVLLDFPEGVRTAFVYEDL